MVTYDVPVTKKSWLGKRSTRWCRVDADNYWRAQDAALDMTRDVDTKIYSVGHPYFVSADYDFPHPTEYIDKNTCGFGCCTRKTEFWK